MSIHKLIDWSKKEFIHLPWRKNRSLYRTLVSEIMLQQTTVSTVKNHFDLFMERFPTLESLACATEDELTVAWKGLGYYRRARNLKKIAEALVFEHGGKFPHDLEALQLIPGIGPYTAGALVAIGMDKRALAVDANLERVIARLYGLKESKGLKLQKKIQQLFNSKEIFREKVSFRALNEALMDLGRTYCQSRKATCELCFLKKECQAYQSGKPLQYPVQAAEKKLAVEHELHLLRVYVMKGKKLLVYRKSEGEWLSGQYEVPTFILHSTDERLKQYPSLTKPFAQEVAGKFKTGITKYKIENRVLVADEKMLKSFKFSREVEWREMHLADANFSTATLKGLRLILK